MLEAPLRRATISTFEELGFLFADVEPTEQQRAAAPAGAVRVGFNGPESGALIVRVYGEILPSLAANMLGSIEPPEARLQQDALGEVANVICGSVLPATRGTEAVFRLGAPAPVLEEGRAEVLLFVAAVSATPGAEVTS